MRIFGRSKISKFSAARVSAARPSAARRSSAALAAEHVAEPVGQPAHVGQAVHVDLADLARTDEMPIVREIGAYPAVVTPDVIESRTGAANGEDGDSDVFVCRRSSPDFADEDTAAAAAELEASAVTLFVYGWENVEPGPLSWAFPSLRTALDAVKTMRNAVEWCIVAGHEWSSIDAARESGAVLIEQNA